MNRISRHHLTLAATLWIIWLVVGFQGAESLWAQMSKVEQETPANWSPTRGAAARSDYVGPAVCAECHSWQAASQRTMLMAHAAARPAESDILRAHPRLTFRLGAYTYQITSDGTRSIYLVSDGSRTISEPILYAFGFGWLGQTYVFEHQGSYYESRVSYFSAIQNLDITIGHTFEAARSVEEAIGNRLGPSEAGLCFSCHTTAAVSGGALDVTHLLPGVTCEACHSPGAKHVAAMKSGNFKSRWIFNPGRLRPDELTDFCGACHRTWLEVRSLGTRGIRTVRFQPYRLVSSRCWDPDDSRITCLACHNPHQPLVQDAAAYDSKCLACHLAQQGVKKNADHPGAACPVSNRNCVTCHMPRVELPGAHAQFTDHYIRVARAGEGYPE